MTMHGWELPYFFHRVVATAISNVILLDQEAAFLFTSIYMAGGKHVFKYSASFSLHFHSFSSLSPLTYADSCLLLRSSWTLLEEKRSVN